MRRLSAVYEAGDNSRYRRRDKELVQEVIKMPKPLLQLVIQSSSPIWFPVAWSQQQVRCMHCRSRRCLNWPHLFDWNDCACVKEGIWG
jgi:hypothetical protein